MDSGQAVDLMREALGLVLLLAAPILVTGLVVSLVVSILQAVTQIQEHTLSFVPRILAMLGALMVTGPWMLTKLADFTRQVFGPLP